MIPSAAHSLGGPYRDEDVSGLGLTVGQPGVVTARLIAAVTTLTGAGVAAKGIRDDVPPINILYGIIGAAARRPPIPASAAGYWTSS